MTPFKNRLKTPEEIELEHKYQRLAKVMLPTLHSNHSIVGVAKAVHPDFKWRY